mmetsp:Transcript_8415/g.15214  ORF Transcript_8415/g.15214 Transcript_8415/m.15214 type:complete len:233 (-) Transcript_8415:2200-2898(-)
MDNKPISSLLAIPAPATTSTATSEDAFDFTQLKLIEKPDSPWNSHSLPQTLEHCDGYLDKLPLKQPNVDQRNPQTIADMINILTDPAAEEEFERAMDDMTIQQEENKQAVSISKGENTHNVFDYNSSDVMIEQLAASNRNVSHIELCFVFGWVTRPGCISLYNKDGKTYAVSEGRWMLTPFRGNWIWGGGNINVNQDIIKPVWERVLYYYVFVDMWTSLMSSTSVLAFNKIG